MTLYHLIILALIQGITEFLPISSSGHLVIAHALIEGDKTADWDNDLMIDVAVHIGTLLSVLLYFRHDVLNMIQAVWAWVSGQKKTEQQRLVLYVLAGSVPVIVAGFILHLFDPVWLRSITIMAWSTLIFGVLLWWIDRIKPLDRTLDNMRFRDAVLIGLSQALALIPGTSRSGITMTTARWLGFSRTDAARYSLLLAMVAISGAGALSSLDLIQTSNPDLTANVAIAVGLAFVSGLAAITLMMKWLQNASFAVFAIYRIVMGLGLLTALYTGII